MEQWHREVGSKILVEAAIGHGLKTEAPTKPPRKPRPLALLAEHPEEADKAARIIQVHSARGHLQGRSLRLFRRSDGRWSVECGWCLVVGGGWLEVVGYSWKVDAAVALSTHCTHSHAAQAMARARGSRNSFRKVVASMWRKKFDKASGYFFYENVLSGETLWEPPAIFARLFPGSNW